MQLYKKLIEYKVFVSIFLFLLSFGAFSLSLKNSFVWDDVEVIEKNYYSFKSAHITSMVIPREEQVKSMAYYRPLVPISMVVDWDIWGLSPFGFHLSNIIFHPISPLWTRWFLRSISILISFDNVQWNRLLLLR